MNRFDITSGNYEYTAQLDYFMTGIGFRLHDAIFDYLSGDISKERFKQEVRRVEQNTEGANWFPILLAVLDELDLANEEDKVAVEAAFLEMYSEEDLSRVFGTDLIDKAEYRAQS